MLEKINQKSAPKEVVNALITLYDKGELEKILKKYSYLTKIYRNSSENFGAKNTRKWFILKKAKIRDHLCIASNWYNWACNSVRNLLSLCCK